MKLVPYDMQKIPGRGVYKRSENLRILEEFAESGLECAKVEDYTQKNANSCISALNNSIKLYNKNGIQAIMRGGDVFLIKTI